MCSKLKSFFLNMTSMASFYFLCSIIELHSFNSFSCLSLWLKFVFSCLAFCPSAWHVSLYDTILFETLLSSLNLPFCLFFKSDQYSSCLYLSLSALSTCVPIGSLLPNNTDRVTSYCQFVAYDLSDPLPTVLSDLVSLDASFIILLKMF